MLTDYNQMTPAEAVTLQRQLKDQLQLNPLDKPVRTIAGADISFNKFSTTVYAGIVILRFPELTVIREEYAITEVSFPYIPGLLAFREIPAIMEVWNKLDIKPDVTVFDGHGIAHPRRMGIAAHFGVVQDTVTIGCAKSLLCGKYEEPGPEPFSESELRHKGELVGTVLRTKRKCKPVFVSPGNHITLAESVELLRQCTGKYRIPEPTRLGHLLVNRIRKEYGQDHFATNK